MEPTPDFHKNARAIRRMLSLIFGFFLVISAFLIYLLTDPTLSAFRPDPEPPQLAQTSETPAGEDDFDRVEDGIHVRTGFKAEGGYMTVVQNCTNCHSAQLVTQNRMSREGWEATIRWMQETQNLWDLGNNEAIILDYLAEYYAPEKKGRRQNLQDIQWYALEE